MNQESRKRSIAPRRVKRVFAHAIVFALVLLFIFSNLAAVLLDRAGLPQIAENLKVKEALAAVAHDAASESHTGTTGNTSSASFSWTHTPVGTPKGVLVFVYTISATDKIAAAGVTYGTATMTRVTGGAAIDTVTEPGRTDTFFLGASVPTGAQTVTVNRVNDTTVMYATAQTVTAATDTELTGIILLQEDGTMAEQSVNDGSTGINSVRYAGAYSGLASPPGVGANSTLLNSIDFGAYGTATARETTAGQGARPVGFSTASDDRAAVHVAIREKATTLATGSDPAAATIAPGAAATDVDKFTLQTTAGTDTITSVTVNLSTNSGVLRLAITNDTPTELGFTTSPVTGSNTISVSSMSAGTSATIFRVRVTPLSHSAMPAPAGGAYAITAPVTAWAGTAGYSHGGSDTNSTALTIDNASPNGATSVSGTAGNTANTINWTTSDGTNGPFDTTNGSVILRWAASSAGSEVPAEGNSSYTAGNTITTATVACVISSATSAALSKIDGTGGDAGCTTTALTNGQAYTYKAFQRDTNGNYDVGVLIGTFTPAAATLTIGATAGAKVANLNSGDGNQFVHNTSCTTAATCAAFTLAASGGTVTVTSIKISETGTVAANTDFSDLVLLYDSDANYSNGTTGTFGTLANFAADQTATFTNAGLAISSGSTYYFYIRFDLQSTTPTYPVGGQGIDLQIAANADVGTTGSPTKTGAPATLASASSTCATTSQTCVSPNATSVSYQGGAFPDGAQSGYSVTISGFGFGVAPALSRANCAGAVNTGCVRFTVGGAATVVDADVTSWSATSIFFTVNAGLASNGGASGLEVVAGSQSDATPLTFYIYPRITSFVPKIGFPANSAREYDATDTADAGSPPLKDGEIRLNGNHFGAAAGTGEFLMPTARAATPSSWSDTQIVLQVPTSIDDVLEYTGTIRITRGTDSKQDTWTSFRVLPRITALTPNTGIAGDSISIDGNHFCESGTCPGAGSRSTADNNVTFNSGVLQIVDGNVTGWSHTAVTVTLPSGVATGDVKVKSDTDTVGGNGNSVDSNTKPFTLGNPTPANPANLNQFRSDCTTPIADEGTINATTVCLKGDVSGGTPGENLYLQVEVRTSATAFSDATHESATTVGAPAGGNLSVTVSSLAEGTYKWRARTCGNKNGTHTLACNGTGDYPSALWVEFETGVAPTNDFTIDTAGPVISTVSSGTPGEFTATITWTTNENATSNVEYGKSGVDYRFKAPKTEDTSADLTSHSVAISTNLTCGQAYQFKVKSKDAQANETICTGTVSASCPAFSTFSTTACTNRIMRTAEYLVTQTSRFTSPYTNPIISYANGNGSFDVYIEEASPTVRGAFVEISGVSAGDANLDLTAQVYKCNDGTCSTSTAGTSKTYRIVAVTGSTPQPFTLLHTLPASEFNIKNSGGGFSNDLRISLSGPASVSLVRAKMVVTYNYNP